MASALYVPVRVAPDRPQVYPTPCRAQVDTGSTLTLAGGELAEDLLADHWSRYQYFPPPISIRTADNNSFLAFPIDSAVQVPVYQAAEFIEGAPLFNPFDLNITIYAGIKQGGGVIGWDDCDMLIGMDLLSLFRVTIVSGTTQFDPLPMP